MFNNRRPVVIGGPSGSGKSTLIKYLLTDFSLFRLSVSHTTRQPRPGEKNGREYFFIDRKEFERKVTQGDFFEYQEYNGNYYGTSKSEISQGDRILLLDLERKGVLDTKQRGELDARFIFVWVDKKEIEKRLRKRVEKEKLSDEEEQDIQNRLLEYEEDFNLWKAGLYDVGIENKNIGDAQQELCKFLCLNI